jgi:hypothetical protein
MLEVDQEFHQRGLEMRDDGAQQKLEQLKQFVPEDEMARIMQKQAEESEKAHAELEQFKLQAEVRLSRPTLSSAILYVLFSPIVWFAPYSFCLHSAARSRTHSPTRSPAHLLRCTHPTFALSLQAEKREKLLQIEEQREAFEARLLRERDAGEQALEREMEEKMAEMRAQMEAKKSAQLSELLDAQRAEEERHANELRERKEQLAQETEEARQAALKDQAEKDKAKHQTLVASYVDQRKKIIDTTRSDLEEHHTALQKKLATRRRRTAARKSVAMGQHSAKMGQLETDVKKLDSKLRVLSSIAEDEGSNSLRFKEEAATSPSGSGRGSPARRTSGVDADATPAQRKQRRLSSAQAAQRDSGRRSTILSIGEGGAAAGGGFSFYVPLHFTRILLTV